jgi:O-antigen/teichoic acid export membrane protein
MSYSPASPTRRSFHTLVLRNGVANTIRLTIFAVIGFVLPAILVRQLPQQSYNAWLLILQLGAYISFLDFGLQTAVSKYIAEFDARCDADNCSRILSNSVFLLIALAMLGFLGIGAIALSVKQLFPQLPAELISDVRWGLFLIGASFAISLPASAFASIFSGLQRSGVPVAIQSVTKVIVGAITIAAAFQHWRLSTMAAAVAAVNTSGALVQVAAWKKFVPEFHLRWSLRDAATIKNLLRYCGVLSIWSVAMLMINGLDTTIVARYDFRSTAYYAVSASITLFFTSLISSFCMPLIPAISAISIESSPEKLGAILTRSSRIVSVLTLLTVVPPMFAGYFVFQWWMGHDFAVQGTKLLRLLLVGYAIRQLGLPYATMVIGLGRQWSTTLSPIVEAIVNLTSSILLARTYGAAGVAMGTIIGSVVGIALHFIIGMKRTCDVMSVSRSALVKEALLRPALILAPGLVLVASGRSLDLSRNLPAVLICFVVTIMIAWLVSLDQSDRRMLLRWT